MSGRLVYQARISDIGFLVCGETRFLAASSIDRLLEAQFNFSLSEIVVR
jgi:hypothetical protein